MPEAPSEFTDVLAECIESIENKNRSIAECLARYPEFSHELGQLLPIMVEIKDAPEIRPTLSFREHSKQRLLGKISPVPVGNMTILGALRHKLDSFHFRQSSWRYKMTWIMSILVIASILIGGGTALAADAAVPGEILYPLDRAIEMLQIRLNNSPQQRVALQLRFAEERVLEAQELASGEQGDRLNVALGNYGESIASVAKTISSSSEADKETLSLLLEDRLQQLDAGVNDLVVIDSPEPMGSDGDKDEENYFCITDEIHPVVQSLRVTYEFDEEDTALLMDWFCGNEEEDGFGLGQILLALQTADGDLVEAGELLALRAGGMGWGEIWQDLELIGKPEEAGPPDEIPPVDAPPDHAGPPDEIPPVGAPPDHAGPPDEVPPVDAPPDHAGPSDEEPPADAPPGNGEPHNGNSPGEGGSPND